MRNTTTYPADSAPEPLLFDNWFDVIEDGVRGRVRGFIESVRPVRPSSSDLRQLRCRGSVTPGQQIVQFGDLVIGDAAKNIGEPGLRVDTIELGCFDQRVGNGR